MNKKNPLEMARYLAELKQENRTQEDVAALVDLSPSQVSRYLQLLKLPAELQEQVAAGELPVTQPKKALKRRSEGPRYSALTETHRAIIEELARVTFATQSQLAEYLDRSINVARHAINELVDSRFLEAHREIRPYVYRLSSHGATVAGVTKPRHWMSANAIHQRILRNTIELQVRVKNPTAHFVARRNCWGQGLFPSVGEHLLVHPKEGKNERMLVLIDDYMMSPARIMHCLNRLHDKDKSVSAGTIVLRWTDVVSRVLVCCTDANHAALHAQYIETNRDNLGRPVIVTHVTPLWEIL
jgi:transcriptional regulator with XRE-family HTH domain